MRPILFVIPGLDIRVHSYGVLILCACFAALGIAVWRARREQIHPDRVYELAIWLFLGGAIGARGLYVLFHPETVHRVSDIIHGWQGGNVFYGCILGGLTGSILYWWWRPFPFWAMTDVAAFAVAIGSAIGRIGCFLNGCCYGTVADVPWAVRFPAGSHAWAHQLNAGLIPPDAAWSLPVHPTQLYASIAGFAILAVLLAYLPLRRRQGEAMAVLMVFYAITRWMIEALRSDEPAIFAGMTLSQNISVALAAAGLLVWVVRRRSPASAAPGLPAAPAPLHFPPRLGRSVVHRHSAEPEARECMDKTEFGRTDSWVAGRIRST
jgi:phosphatidylglycerol:prolipoprotein diacylglycerol transferase